MWLDWFGWFSGGVYVRVWAFFGVGWCNSRLSGLVFAIAFWVCRFWCFVGVLGYIMVLSLRVLCLGVLAGFRVLG